MTIGSTKRLPLKLMTCAGAWLAASGMAFGQGATDLQPIDLTPVRLPERDNEFTRMQEFRTTALYKLPAKMYINVNVENTLRLETNAFQTTNRNQPDMIYRVLPDVTVGYAPTQTTRVAANYFMFNDLYAFHGSKLSRTVQSVGLRGDKDWIINPRTLITTGVMGRELFITGQPDLFDILPSVSITRRVGEYGAVYGSVLGQIRWQKFLASKFQEGDQFYSIGTIYRKGKWNAAADATLIDNFGNGNMRFGPDSNHIIVLTMEGGRRLSNSLPLTAFVRAQPIFNIGQENRQGFAGVNFRLFTGLRMEVSKPALFPNKLPGMQQSPI